jgi:dipeptidyl aminopeptidase/acylaminoacyl peptidase
VYDETQNTPEQADPYGTAGWTTHDKYLWIYDRYDLWQIDPTGKEAAIKITSGREHNLQYRYLKLDPKALHIDPTKPIRYSIFNLHTKDAHFGISHKGKMRQTPAQAFSYSRPIKAKKTDTLIWTRENFSTFPNLWISDTEIANPLCLSDANPQQTQYNWGTAEIFRWEIEPGQQEEGILYKPENFDPNKKYPTLVYFYELNSDQIHQYHNPKPSRSVINRTVFVSNEYLVFVPNIRYKTGYPGESALKYVLSGSRALSQASYVDSTRIGIQGQSWGGYQVAYIICRTPFFRAAWAGAAVSNMTSAYGGIRWATGVSRMFQYEKTQSRIGATLWEKPELYIANSPLFMAPDIQTPLAMMHNDNDGAVPWAQSIELFLALRRLNKPVWLLNYNGEPHNLNANSPNGVDLSIRLKQYFDHYLKDQPAPIWMTHGIPALDKGKKFGYETTQ